VPRVTAAHEQEVRERIVAAALRVFGERGYHGATIADVVRESGVSVGSIYTWFKGKDDLFLATCDLASGRGLGELAARLPRGRTVAERLAIAVGFYFDSAEGDAATGAGNADFLVQAWGQVDADPAVQWMDSFTEGNVLAVERLWPDSRAMQTLAVGVGSWGRLAAAALPWLRWLKRRLR